MSAVQNISLKVDEKAHGYAKIYSSLLKSEYQRKRSYASLVALYSFINTIEKTSNTIQKSMTLFRNPLINERYEISDLYVNNYHLEVRVISKGDSVLIPKSHFQYDILPDFYVVIKIDNELKNAELVGFIDSKTIEKEEFNNEYYSVSLSKLINYADFLDKVREEKKYNFSIDDHNFLKANYIAFMDDEIDEDSKKKILKHLFECIDCRTEFCCYTGFEMVSSNMTKYPELLEDNTLDFIGAQVVDNEEYIGKEETIYVGDDNNEEDYEEEPKITINDESNIIQQKTVASVEPLETEKNIDENNNSSDLDNILGPVSTEINDIVIIPDTENPNDNSSQDDLPSDETETHSDDSQENAESEIIEINEDDEKSDKNTEEDVLTEDNIEQDEDSVTNETEENDAADLFDELFDNDSVEETRDDVKEKLEAINVDEDGNFIKKEEEVSESSSQIDVVSDDDIKEDTIEFIQPENGEYLPEIDENNKTEVLLIADDNEGEKMSSVEDVGLVEKSDTSTYKSNMEKVITGYDEAGEPIYSFVENVDKDDINSIDSEVEVLEENYVEPINQEESNDISEEESALIDKFSDLTNEEDVSENTQKNSTDFEIHENQLASVEDLYNEDDNEIVEEEETEIEDENGNENISDEENIKKKSPYEGNPTTDIFDNLAAQSVANAVTQNNNQEDEIETDVDSESENIEQNKQVDDIDIELEEPVDIKKEEPILKNEKSLKSEEEDSNEESYDEDDNEYDEESDEESDEEDYDEDDYEEDEENYDEEDDEDYDEDSASNKSSNQGIIAVVTIIILLIAGGGIFFFMNNKNSSINSVAETPIVADSNVNNTYEQTKPMIPESNQSEAIPSQGKLELENDTLKIKTPEHSDVNRAMTSAFGESNLSIRNINWLCSAELFTDKAFKAYLQNLDSMLKLNLNKNILTVADRPQKNSVEVKLAVDNEGEIKKIVVSDSSGSSQLDEVVLQSIKETFESEKTQILNNDSLKADMYYLKVVIKI